MPLWNILVPIELIIVIKALVFVSSTLCCQQVPLQGFVLLIYEQSS
jgi:hypothetical protein